MQQRKERGQLRHDGVIVVAGIGDKGFSKGDAPSGNAAVYSRHILGRGSRDVAERAARLDPLFVPAHSAKPQLCASLVIWRIERIHKRGTDGTASEQSLKLESRAARICGAGTNAARHRKRHGRVNEIMSYKLQQVGVA